VYKIKTDFGKIGCGDVDWIGLAQDKDRWGALVNSVMKLRILKLQGNCRVASQLVAPRAVFSSIELVRATECRQFGLGGALLHNVPRRMYLLALKRPQTPNFLLCLLNHEACFYIH
jgi:hypothetical protein